MNGDGREDLIVAEQAGWYGGQAWVISGKDRRVLYHFGSPGDDVAPASEPRFQSVGPAGDVDGDGRDDLLIRWKAELDGATDEGWTVHVVSGADGHLVRAHSLPRGALWRAASVADWSCDGRMDLVLSARDGVRIVEGDSGAPVREFWPSTPSAHLWSVTAIGDLDGDGMRELACAEREVESVTTAVVVLSMNAAEPLLRWRPGSDYRPTFTFADAGDVDGDGHVDFAIATLLNGSPRRSREAVRVHSGVDGRVLVEVTSACVGDDMDPFWDADFGSSLAKAGDLDGDGSSEILVGAQSLNLGGGGFAVLSARTGQVLLVEDELGKASCCPHFASGIDAGADWDADGVPDWVVSSGSITGGPGIGKVLIYSGRTLSVLEEITRESLGL